MIYKSKKFLSIDFLVDNKVQEQVKHTVQLLKQLDWQFLIVDQTRGKCYYQQKIITIPSWAVEKHKRIEGYLDWYIAHECAHAHAGTKANHGPIFMDKLKHICPKEYLHFETSYKPQNANAAGISATVGNEIIKIGKKTFDVDLDDLL